MNIEGMKIDPVAAQWAAGVASIRADVKSGKIAEFHGRLVTRAEIARAERIEGGYRFR